MSAAENEGVNAYFQKTLSVNDIEILIYIHDQLGFSTEMIEYLIEYCVSIDKLDVRYAEGIAKNWYKEGVKTLEDAKQASESGNPLYRAVFKALGIDRKLPTHLLSAGMQDQCSFCFLRSPYKSHRFQPGIWRLYSERP